LTDFIHTPTPLYLFLSDLHLGRGTPAASRAAERDALALLDAHEADVRAAVADGRGGGLYLVGDVFDQFIEYRRLVPKGFARLQGRLAAWTDAGLPVTYLVGNRDPWHLDYFASELGVRLVRGAITERLAGRTVYLAHGDGLVPSERAYNLLKPILRHPLSYRLYRTLLPGDSGYRLARRIARLGDGAPDAPTVHGLRAAAHRFLTTTAADLVVFGHGHVAEHEAWPEGAYLNPGYWYEDRTFARLDADGPALLRWTGHAAEPFSPTSDETNME
jgi:UDP-2,3-diacylglucosamine hydrolase